MSLNIDVKLITDNLVELLTNTINISSLFEKIFYSKEPDYNVPLEQWVYEDDHDPKMYPKTTYVKNLAAIEEELAGTVGSKTRVLNQADYDALPEKDPEVLYFII